MKPQSGLTALSAVLVACGPNAPAEPVSYHAHVAPIIERECLGCHDGAGIAPFPLSTYEEVRAVGPVIRTAVVERTMPPWNLDSSGDCGDFEQDRWLSDDAIDTITRWIDQGMPQGDLQAEVRAPVMQPVEIETDAVLKTPVYRPRASLSDDYRCFIVDPGVSQPRFLTGFEVIPGAPAIAHHMILFTVDDEVAEDQARRLDEADPGPGYTCFGSSLLSPSSSRIVAGWAPGTAATRYPKGVGIRLHAGRSLIVQMHYNTVAGDLEDTTEIRLELRDQVERRAEFLPLADLGMRVPPGQSLALTEPFRVALPGLGGFVRGIFPHMHQLGRTLQARIVHPDGTSTCLASVPRWDFDWQQFYFPQRGIYAASNDRIELQCGFDTRSRDEDVTWGEGTQDEMCLLGLLVTLN